MAGGTVSCDHLEWAARVDVGNVTDGEDGPVIRRTVEVRVWCAACQHPLEFQGLPVGIDTHGPTMSVDGLEARLVATPKGTEMLATGRVAAIFRSKGSA